MGPERRSCARRILYSPEYLDMGADNGGVVVDLSEGGLRFQAVGRVEAESDLSLSFSLGAGYRIDVQGRIAWITPRGNSGGIAFENLSSDSRSLIREWLAKPEAELRSDAAAGTLDHEGRQSLDDISSTASAEEKLETRAVPAQVAPSGEQFLVGNAFGESPQEAHIEEISAPDEIALSDARLPREFLTTDPRTLNASPFVAPPFRAQATESAPAPAAASSSFTSLQGGKFTPVGQKSSAPAATSVREGILPSALPHSAASSAAPVQSSPQNFLPPTRKSFSVAPSISALAAARRLPPLTARGPNRLADARMFPPQSVENIFARSPWTALQHEPEPHNKKAVLFFAILCILTAVALVLFAYTSMHRQKIGSVIQRIGSSLAGQSSMPRSAKPANGSPVSNSLAASSGGSTEPANPPVANPPEQTRSTRVPPLNTKTASSSPGVSSSGAKQSALLPTGGAGQSAAANSNSDRTQAAQTAQGTVRPMQALPSHSAGNSQSAQANSLSAAAQQSAMAQAEYLRAQKYLTGAGVLPDPATAAEWFWRSLEAGNTNAALPLAHLYLRGEGVSQNCTQAKILLDAAARKGNAEAERRLQELPANCE